MSDSLYTTAAHSSRVTKRKLQRNPSSSSSSPFDFFPRRKSAGSPAKKIAAASKASASDEQHGRLVDNGLVPSLATGVTTLSGGGGVRNLMAYIPAHMFTPVPDRGSGMSSTRVAEVLNYRLHLPPIVSTAHLHALSQSPTSTEREVVSLCARGSLRRVHIPHLGHGRSAAGEGVVVVAGWERLLGEHEGLLDATKEKYLRLMREHPAALGISASSFAQAEVVALTQAGFLTSSTSVPGSAEHFLSGATANASLSTANAAKAASGSMAAIGGLDAFLGSGGGGGSGPSSRDSKLAMGTVHFSLPNTGPYLKLLVESRTHLVSLLTKISPRYREAPMDVLREKWDGGVATGVKGEDARKERGDRRGEVLPGKTRKWRSFQGLDFRWVLEECVGSGMVELFGTGAVGIGVRAT